MTRGEPVSAAVDVTPEAGVPAVAVLICGGGRF